MRPSKKKDSRASIIVTTVEARHIFLDIVNYTYERSIEAQTELITILNSIVKQSVRQNRVKLAEVIFIPTGDGMCISLINKPNPYDLHITIALNILKLLHEHNIKTKDNMRRFNLRIGINENTDNLVKDINGQINVSGSGINFASRILTLCDDNQILVGNTVFNRLVQREKYIKSFVNYTGEVKHNVPLEVYQYRNSDYQFLNNETPSIFRPQIIHHQAMPEIIAYYIYHCMVNERFFIEQIKTPQAKYSLRILTFNLSEDRIAKSKVTKSRPDYTKKIKNNGNDYFKYLQSIEFWTACDLSTYIIEKHLMAFNECFTEEYLFVSELGINRLKQEHPKIFEEMGN